MKDVSRRRAIGLGAVAVTSAMLPMLAAYNTSPLLINGTSSPILNISLNGTSTNLMPMLNGMLLPKRYAYLNPTLEFFIPENDTDQADLDYLQAKSLEIDFSPAEKLLASYW
jgi:uncharacterized protein